MIAYVYTIGAYRLNARNFEIKKIYSYFTVNGTVRMKQVENGPYKSITLINDLRALFPEEQISMS